VQLVLVVDATTRTHNEDVPPLYKCKFLILSIVSNAAAVAHPKAQNVEAKWTRPDLRKVKINVDASFHQDLWEGALRAVIRGYQG
jgi:hypothetical protein